MGMFDKDKELGRSLTTVFDYKDEFILWDAVVTGEKKTDIGMARETKLTVSRLASSGEKFEVTTLASAIADKATEATPEDFPAVVQLLQVDGRFAGKATVLQFVRDYRS